MIIKIESYNENDQYRMIDGIEKYVLKKRKLKQDRQYEPDLIVFDVEKECTCMDGEGCNNCTTYYDLICKKRNGDEYTISFDTIAYIMNDEGKTIEKIVANYND